MNYKEEFLKKIKESIKISSSEQVINEYCILDRLIRLCNTENFDFHIKNIFYENSYSDTFDECFTDFHKQLRQVDVFENPDLDMLLYYYISSNNYFYNICEKVIKADKKSKFYNNKFDIWQDDEL